MQTISQALDKLQTSAFRSRFHLSETEKEYVRQKGMDTIRRHAEDFIRQRLAPVGLQNDGHQTPMHGHPVFVAQHACACCCRKCLQKWYRVSVDVPLNAKMQQQIVDLLLAWIEREMQG